MIWLDVSCVIVKIEIFLFYFSFLWDYFVHLDLFDSIQTYLIANNMHSKVQWIYSNNQISLNHFIFTKLFSEIVNEEYSVWKWFLHNHFNCNASDQSKWIMMNFCSICLQLSKWNFLVRPKMYYIFAFCIIKLLHWISLSCFCLTF